MSPRRLFQITATIALVVRISAHAYGQVPGVDQEVAAVSKEIQARNYSKAIVMIANLKTEARKRLGGMLPKANLRAAMLVSTDQQSTLSSLEQARLSYNSGDWEGALYSFTAAQFGVSRLDAQAGPEEKFTRDASEAERQGTPAWFHLAARSALAAGRLSEALQYAGRETAMIPKAYPPPAMAVIQHRALTLMGLIYVAQNEIQAADNALLASVKDVPAGAFRSSGPSMALVKELLAKGQTDVVLRYLEICLRLGWSGQQRLDTLNTAINAGGIPNFTPLELSY